MKKTHTLIVGASAAGLACAAQLKKRQIEFEIIEKHEHVAHAWRSHYDRLHLHTNKGSSHLPFLRFPKDAPKYPSRDEVVAYLENYVEAMNLKPQFKLAAQHISRDTYRWITQTSSVPIESKHLILCTGNTNIPHYVSKSGLDSFTGKILHSSEYKNGKEFKGQKTLVIGFGNSACEIAICLHEYGAIPAMSVRSPVNVIPRDILGIPVLSIGIVQSKLPPRMADQLNKPLLNLLVGNIEKHGLKKLPYGPIEQIVKHHQIPLLDIGTMKLIKQKKVQIYGDISHVEQGEIQFEDGRKESFDAIIMATGYKTGLEQIIEISPERKEDIQLNIKQRKYCGVDNLYFCGFHVSPTGMLREINMESGIIADKIMEKVNGV